MDILIEVKYADEEVLQIVKNHHQFVFGDPPSGYKWEVADYFGKKKVKAEKVKLEPVADISEVTGNEEGIEVNL